MFDETELLNEGKGKYCVFKTFHSNGKFYIGKGLTEKVRTGDYKGSGKILVDNFKKYPKKEWISEIISIHDTEVDAYLKEAEIVTEDLIKLEKCLNINLGGRGGCRRKQSKEECLKRGAAIKKAISSKEHREKMSKAAKLVNLRPGMKEIFSENAKKIWSNKDLVEKINKSRQEACGDDWKLKLSNKTKKSRRNPFKVEVFGIEYETQVNACRALNMRRLQLRKLPSFREILCY